MTHGLLRALIVAAALGIAGLGDAAQGVAGERPGALADLRVAKGERDIAEVWLAGPTTRYRHYVLGSRYEASRVEVRLADGRRLAYVLPEDSVFEDRQPRLADLDGDGRDEIVLVRADIERGASLAVLGVDRGRLVVIAQGPPTGRAHTWLNPAGIADFDGDGSVDIAYVQMPHILGRLRIFTLRERKLVQIATLPDTSNHVAGSPQMGLSAVADFDGDGIADLPSRASIAARCVFSVSRAARCAS